MAGSWTSNRFPRFDQSIRRLTEQHRELEDEPLHLALAYSPAHCDQKHIYLLEVIGAFGESLAPERDLFEVIFEATAGFPMSPDEKLHLILTSPHELKFALSHNWPSAIEIAKAIRSGDFEVLFEDEIGDQAFDQLQKAAYPQAANGG